MNQINQKMLFKYFEHLFLERIKHCFMNKIINNSNISISFGINKPNKYYHY